MRNPLRRAILRAAELTYLSRNVVRDPDPIAWPQSHGFQVYGFGQTLGEATGNYMNAHRHLTERRDYT